MSTKPCVENPKPNGRIRAGFRSRSRNKGLNVLIHSQMLGFEPYNLLYSEAVGFFLGTMAAGQTTGGTPSIRKQELNPVLTRLTYKGHLCS